MVARTLDTALAGLEVLDHGAALRVHGMALGLAQEGGGPGAVVGGAGLGVGQHVPGALELLPFRRVEVLAGLVGVVFQGFLAPVRFGSEAKEKESQPNQLMKDRKEVKRGFSL